MSRKRMVDPEFWLDEEVTARPFVDRLFFIGSWNFADDFGVIENSPKKLKAQIFPYDEVDCAEIVKTYIELKKFLPFKADGKEWLYIKNFLKYQRVDKPSKNRNPQAPKEVLAEDSPSTQEPLPDEEKRREVKLSKEKIEHSVEYLRKIPDADLTEFSVTYLASKSQVKTKGEDLYFYCGSKSKTYKNYRMFLIGALRKDFQKRPPMTPRAEVTTPSLGKGIPKSFKDSMSAIAKGMKA